MQNLQELRSGNAENVLFNLSRNIVALQVETLFCAYYHVCDQLLSQQNGVVSRGNMLRKVDSSSIFCNKF